ncbi:MAG: hypothetical protein PVH61_16385 [Candidatus Aminicenantes bacterium]
MEKKDSLSLFIYGSVFTNKKYETQTGLKPFKITGEKLLQFFEEYKRGMVEYLKGSFVLILYDEEYQQIMVITDRLNVIPLYYFFKEGIFGISSSMRMLFKTGLIAKDIDQYALTEQLMFDYVLGTKTFFKEISQTGPGCIYLINSQGISQEQYWSVEQLYHEKLMKKSDALETVSRQLHENVNLYASDRKKVLVSFTGGFDGRTNVAMLDKAAEDFLCYSYGIPGSRQIEIPKNICEKLNLQYKPIYLHREFEENYEHFEKMAVEFSNGTAPILRANYPYAYSRLNQFSDTIITGLFGSEILRPIYNQGIQINDHSQRLFLSRDIQASIKKSILELKGQNYIKDHILDNSLDFIIEEFKKEFFEKYKNYDYLIRFFFFIIKEGIRKYFMQEIQIERLHVTTRFPYFDDDLMDLIYKTPFAGMYNGFLGKSKYKRRHGQLLYAHILKKYEPGLGKMVLDRGYTPDDLIKPFPINYLNLYIGVKKAKKYIKIHGNDTFNPGKWNRSFIKEVINGKNFIDECDRGIVDGFRNNQYLNDLLTYSHMISLNHYISTL